MTAPTRPQALAPADAVVRAFKAEANWWHQEWREHVDACTRCEFGGECWSASYLADRADSYGARVIRAEERARR